MTARPLLFEAKAASLALLDAPRNFLVFRVAAGAQGRGVVGLEIPPDRGFIGYVFSTGQALAISDVARDPRFGRAFAEQTQYVPRSIVAVPLLDERGTIGVLEVLDKRSEATFSICDVELAGVAPRREGHAPRPAAGPLAVLAPLLDRRRGDPPVRPPRGTRAGILSQVRQAHRIDDRCLVGRRRRPASLPAASRGPPPVVRCVRGASDRKHPRRRPTSSH